MGQFTGKTVLITGASYGLGEGFAEGFAKEGADLILTARSKDMLEAVAARCRALGSKVTVAPGDVAIEEDDEHHRVHRGQGCAAKSHSAARLRMGRSWGARQRGLARLHHHRNGASGARGNGHGQVDRQPHADATHW
ncbi:MAG: SDR family NAD(P)-dependent oxidoreductase [Actinobacteria bacterium]|nr:SDR family NAD(P)-dependent oxidoreductase [Actinomycetota bacterium]